VKKTSTLTSFQGECSSRLIVVLCQLTSVQTFKVLQVPQIFVLVCWHSVRSGVCVRGQ